MYVWRCPSIDPIMSGVMFDVRPVTSQPRPRPSQKRVMGIQEKVVRKGDSATSNPGNKCEKLLCAKISDVFKAKTLAPPSSPSSLL